MLLLPQKSSQWYTETKPLMAVENVLGCCIKDFFPFNVEKARVTSVHKMGGKQVL